jgi:predicted ATPase
LETIQTRLNSWEDAVSTFLFPALFSAFALGEGEARGDELAQLWRGQGKSDKARDLLAPVYGWFTEGFETLNLKEAKALLDELHA